MCQVYAILVTMNEVVKVDNSRQVNPYKEMAPDARSVLRKLMFNSRNEKIRKETAIAVLDRAGEAAQKSEDAQRPIIIKDSQVALLMRAAEEAIL